MSAIFLTTKKTNKSSGFTLIETIIYMALLVIVTGIITQIVVSMGGVYKNIKITRELESSGTIAMDAMLREIRNASSVVTGGSIIGSSPGSITVSGIDESLNDYEVSFTVSSGKIFVSKDGETPVALTSSSGDVSYLLFTKVTSPNSEGVRIELEMSKTSGSLFKSERFYGFAILRGSY